MEVLMIIIPFIVTILMMLGMAADGADPPATTYAMEEAPKPTPTVTPSATPQPVLTEEQQVQAIAKDMGVMVEVYRVADCERTPGALACYLPDLKVIFITDLGMSKGFDYLPCILSHENRHAYQDMKGMIKYSSTGDVLNRKFLEQDADEAQVCG